MTDTIEAVARILAPMLEGGREYDQMPATRRELKIWNRAGMCSINDATQEDAREAAEQAITAHTKALVEGAGGVGRECAALAVQIDPLLLGGPDARLLHQAAATIAAQKAEIERLTEREAQAKLDGVRAGIEAAAKLDESRQWSIGIRSYEIRALDAEAIAKGITTADTLSDLIAGDADLIVPDTLADSDGDDGA